MSSRTWGWSLQTCSISFQLPCPLLLCTHRTSAHSPPSSFSSPPLQPLTYFYPLKFCIFLTYVGCHLPVASPPTSPLPVRRVPSVFPTLSYSACHTPNSVYLHSRIIIGHYTSTPKSQEPDIHLVSPTATSWNVVHVRCSKVCKIVNGAVGQQYWVFPLTSVAAGVPPSNATRHIHNFHSHKTINQEPNGYFFLPFLYWELTFKSELLCTCVLSINNMVFDPPARST